MPYTGMQTALDIQLTDIPVRQLAAVGALMFVPLAELCKAVVGNSSRQVKLPEQDTGQKMS